MNTLPDPRLCRTVIYAWIGEDQLGTGEWGIKQGITPMGVVPLVAVRENRLTGQNLDRQLRQMLKDFGKPLFLARFVFDGVVKEIT